MTSFAGLDVSVRETAICVVDQSRKVVAERKVATEPEDIIAPAPIDRQGVRADRIGGRPIVAVAGERPGRSRAACGLSRNPAHEGTPQGANAQQERPQ